MTTTTIARAALVAGAVTVASIGLAGNACAAPLVHTAAPSAVAETAVGGHRVSIDGTVALAARESSTKSGAMKVLPWVALAAGGLGLGSVGGALLIGRCRRAGGSPR